MHEFLFFPILNIAWLKRKEYLKVLFKQFHLMNDTGLDMKQNNLHSVLDKES